MKMRNGACAAGLVAACGLAVAQPTLDGVFDPATEGQFYSDVLWTQNQPTAFGDNQDGDFIPGGSGDVGNPEDVSTGFELAIPRSALGNPTSFRIAGWINSGDRTFMSNQILHDGSLPIDTPNIGNAPNFETDARFPGKQYVVVGSFDSGTPTVDGTLDGVYMTRFFTQTNYTGFGANDVADAVGGGGSEIDALYVAADATNIYIFVAGNVEANGNGLDLFFDVDNGATGANSISSGSGGTGGGRLDGMSGIVFDSDFAANYYVTVDGDGSSINVFHAEMFAGGTSSNVRLLGTGGYAVVGGGLSGGDTGAPAASATVDNSNVEGVVGSPIAEPDTPMAPDIDWAYGSEINNIRAYIDAGDTNTLYLFIGANLEVNFNKLNLFIDAAPGGQNVLRDDNVDSSFGGLNRMAGLTFDEGFEANYWMNINIGIDGGTGELINFIDAAVLRTNGPLVDPFTLAPLDYGAFSGVTRNEERLINFDGPRVDIQDGFTTALFTQYGPRLTQIDPSNPIPGLIQGFLNNSNTGGVTGDSASASAAAAVNTGVELAIDLDELGWDGSRDIRIAGWISSGDFGFVSNQVIGGLPGSPADNLGEVSEIDFSQIEGTQYVNLSVEPDPGCNAADLAPPFGVLDIFDVLEFLTLFEAEDPRADLAPPFGVWDIFDVLEFLTIFEQGCP